MSVKAIFYVGLFTPGHFMHFILIGQLSDPEKTRCKCPLKRFRDAFKSIHPNGFEVYLILNKLRHRAFIFTRELPILFKKKITLNKKKLWLNY